MYKKLRMTDGERSEYQVFVIKKVLNKMKKNIEKVHEDRKFMIDEKEKKIVELSFYLNWSTIRTKIKNLKNKPNTS